MHIRDLDLNLLVVFDAVMRTRSITVAAQQLGRAQPTISNALSRLRAVCADPLFVRTRTGLEPTALARAIADPVADALLLVHKSLSRSAKFDPSSARTTFTILMSDIGQMALAPALVRRLRQIAPHASLIAAQLPREAYGEALETGRADLAIGALRHLNAGFFQQRLFDDTYVCVACANHPTIGSSATLEQYLDAPHVGIISAGISEIEIERLLLPPGRARRVCVRVPHYLAAPALLPGTDLLVTVPARVLRAFPYQDKLKRVSLPIAPPAISVHQYWHERAHADAGNKWLRQLVAELFQDWQGPDAREQAPHTEASRPAASRTGSRRARNSGVDGAIGKR